MNGKNSRYTNNSRMMKQFSETNEQSNKTPDALRMEQHYLVQESISHQNESQNLYQRRKEGNTNLYSSYERNSRRINEIDYPVNSKSTLKGPLTNDTYDEYGNIINPSTVAIGHSKYMPEIKIRSNIDLHNKKHNAYEHSTFISEMSNRAENTTCISYNCDVGSGHNKRLPCPSQTGIDSETLQFDSRESQRVAHEANNYNNFYDCDPSAAVSQQSQLPINHPISSYRKIHPDDLNAKLEIVIPTVTYNPNAVKEYDSVKMAIVSEFSWYLTAESADLIIKTIGDCFEDWIMKTSNVNVTFQEKPKYVPENYCVVINCSNERSAEWIKDTVDSMSPLWEGGRLTAIRLNELAKLVKCGIFLPRCNKDVKIIMKALTILNPDYKINKWNLENLKSSNEGIFLDLRVPEPIIIDRLLPKKCKIYYRLGSVRLLFFTPEGTLVPDYLATTPAPLTRISTVSDQSECGSSLFEEMNADRTQYQNQNLRHENTTLNNNQQGSTDFEMNPTLVRREDDTRSPGTDTDRNLSGPSDHFLRDDAAVSGRLDDTFHNRKLSEKSYGSEDVCTKEIGGFNEGTSQQCYRLASYRPEQTEDQSEPNISHQSRQPQSITTKRTPFAIPQLEYLMRQTRHFFNRAKNTRQDVDWAMYKTFQSEYKKELRRCGIKKCKKNLQNDK